MALKLKCISCNVLNGSPLDVWVPRHVCAAHALRSEKVGWQDLIAAVGLGVLEEITISVVLQAQIGETQYARQAYR